MRGVKVAYRGMAGGWFVGELVGGGLRREMARIIWPSMNVVTKSERKKRGGQIAPRPQSG